VRTGGKKGGEKKGEERKGEKRRGKIWRLEEKRARL
jgi:hypothetical protein